MIEDLIRETEKSFDQKEPESNQFWTAEKNWNGTPPLSEYKEIRRIARQYTALRKMDLQIRQLRGIISNPKL